MNKIRIKSTPLFKQVAEVIGEERAQIELAIAYHGYYKSESGALKFNFDEDLLYAFCWLRSPQDEQFCSLIYDGINPCSN